MPEFIKNEISRYGDINPDYIKVCHNAENIKITFIPNGSEFILECNGLSTDGYGYSHLTYFQSFQNFVYETAERRNNTFSVLFRHDSYTFDQGASDSAKSWIRDNIADISQEWGPIGVLITEIFRAYINGENEFNIKSK